MSDLYLCDLSCNFDASPCDEKPVQGYATRLSLSAIALDL
jgi:hypothetical protein